MVRIFNFFVGDIGTSSLPKSPPYNHNHKFEQIHTLKFRDRNLKSGKVQIHEYSAA